MRHVSQDNATVGFLSQPSAADLGTALCVDPSDIASTISEDVQ
jgi:hypothetical protein